MDTICVNRLHKYDTMRFLLLFLVILGHEIELFWSGRAVYLYKIIYTFHMPAFLFITGKFAKFDKKRVLKQLLLPYLVFQILYLCFAGTVLTEGEPAVKIQFTTPYWILWYLLAVIFCYALLPFLPKKGSPYAAVILPVSFAVSILAGFETTLGYYLTLSRFLVFLPFFLWGYYQDSLAQALKKRSRSRAAVSVIVSLVIIVLGEYYIIRSDVPAALLYGSCSYAVCESSAADRLIALITAAAWIRLLDTAVPNIRIPVVSDLGRNTMPVFLFHAFVVKLLGKFGFFHYPQIVNLLLACVLAVVIIFIFGNSLFAKLFKKVF